MEQKNKPMRATSSPMTKNLMRHILQLFHRRYFRDLNGFINQVKVESGRLQRTRQIINTAQTRSRSKKINQSSMEHYLTLVSQEPAGPHAPVQRVSSQPLPESVIPVQLQLCPTIEMRNQTSQKVMNILVRVLIVVITQRLVEFLLGNTLSSSQFSASPAINFLQYQL